MSQVTEGMIKISEAAQCRAAVVLVYLLTGVLDDQILRKYDKIQFWTCRAEMQKAVEEERYSAAAALRDSIAQLEVRGSQW